MASNDNDGAPSSRFALCTWLGDRRRGALVLVALVFVLFGSATCHRATLDSRHFLAEDLRVRELRVGDLLAKGWWNPDPDDPAQVAGGADLYRPLTLVWMAAWWQTAGAQDRADLQPTLLNLANVGLHALSVVLRFWWFLLLLGNRPRAGAIAFGAALLLAVHPIATETVATQVGAAEGLAAVCGSAALLAWHHWQVGGSRRAPVWFAVWLLLALLAKENAIAIAALAPLGSLLLLRHPWRQSVVVALVAALPVVAWLALRLLITGSATAVKDPVFAGYGPVAALQSALAAIGWYDVPALLWPFRLLAFVSHQALPPPDGFGDWRVLVGVSALLGVGAAFAAALRRDRVAAFGLLFFAIAFLPVSNLVVPLGAIAATRFLYLPMTGLALAAAIGAGRLAASAWPGVRRLAAALTVALPVLLMVATLCEVPVWRSQVTLFRAMAARLPDTMSLSNLGAALRAEVDAAMAVVVPENTAKADRDAAVRRVTALQYEALAAFEAAAVVPQPNVPGTTAVPEDLLELCYQSRMNEALAAVRWQGDFERGRRCGAAMIDIARRGRAQSEVVHGQANWAPLESDAECLLCEFALQQAQRAGSDQRLPLVQQAEQHIGRARALAPGALRPEEQWINLVAMRGNEAALAEAFADLYARVRDRVAHLSAAVRIALAYSRFLERKQPERSLAIALETIVVGKDRFGNAAAFFEYGARGMRAQDPAVRQLARRALEVFVERADTRDAQNVAVARQLLARGP